MAGSHLRSGRRGPGRTLILTAIVALLVGLLAGGGATLVLLESDDDTSVETDDIPTDAERGSAAAEPDATTASPPGSITLAFAGDINVEHSLATRLENDPEGFVGPFADLLRGADLAVGNLEAALVTGGTPLDKEYTFRAPPSVIDALVAGGFDVLSAANNHAMDYGREGLPESIALKRSRADGAIIGIGEDEDEAYAPYVADVGGHTVAIIATTGAGDVDLIESWTATVDQGGVASASRSDRLVEEVVAARAVADTVVVYLHWETAAEMCPNTDQQDLAAELSDAGADLIIGTGAHRVQAAGRLGDSFVGYGLGNFLFGAVSDEARMTGVLLVEVSGRRVLGYEWRPGRIDDRVPIPLEGDEAASAVDAWDGLRDCTDLTG
ncbi:MAG: CapA family protein [Acidimicrobiales bacterium]|nr:CapA family protein [Acidimicrobiales bacterium]